MNATGLAERSRRRFPERLSGLREPAYLPSSPMMWLPVLAAVFAIVTIAWCWTTLSATLQTRASQPAGASPGSPPHPSSERLQGNLAPVFTPQVQRWSPDIQRWAASAGLEPNLVAAVMQIESCGDPSAISSSGAVGLFQVMPYHFRPGENPFDPDTNARVGLTYLADGLQLAHGDARMALAGYNGGHGLLSLPAHRWPDETQRYVVWGTGLLNDIANHRVPSPTMERWLSAGGSLLCRQAESSALR